MNIVLTGPMGSGKTVVGKTLAQSLQMRFIDSDTEFSNRTQYSIPDYFNTYGEQAFREKESDIVKELSKKDNIVLATGGGVVLNPANMRRLRRNGIIVNLQATVQTLYDRLKNTENTRPLLHSSSFIDHIKKYSDGRESYYQNADFFIKTDDISINDIVDTIENVLQLPRIRICACIAGENPQKQIQQAIEKGASLVELRFDLMDQPSIEQLIQQSGLPVIATDRVQSNTLIQAIDAGCDYVDIDNQNPKKEHLISYAKQHTCTVIISMHDYEKTPSSFHLQHHQADLIKIATTIQSYTDGQRILQLLTDHENLIISGMGKKGTYTRVIAPLLGSFLTYASVGKKTAEGQIDIDQLQLIYKKMGVK